MEGEKKQDLLCLSLIFIIVGSPTWAKIDIDRNGLGRLGYSDPSLSNLL